MISIAKVPELATTLLARMNNMRGQRELCDLVLRPETAAVILYECMLW